MHTSKIFFLGMRKKNPSSYISCIYLKGNASKMNSCFVPKQTGSVASGVEGAEPEQRLYCDRFNEAATVLQTVLRGELRPHSCSRGRPSSNVCYFHSFSCKYIFSKLRCRWQEEEQILLRWRDRATAHVPRRRLCTQCSSLPNSAQLSHAGSLKRRRALSLQAAADNGR